MPRAKRLLRPAAIVTSLLLLGGFVCYRSGLFNPGSTVIFMAGSKSSSTFNSIGAAHPSGEPVVSPPPGTEEQKPSGESEKAIFLPGTKQAPVDD
jgi:hypothetical protein